MLKELGVFLIIWAMQLFIFTCAGFTIFDDVEGYHDFPSTLIKMFQMALGGIEFGSLDHSEAGRLVGRVFMLI
jgi:hypothetical protein